MMTSHPWAKLADAVLRRKFWLAILCGAFSTTALPPLSWVWCLPVTWSLIYYMWAHPSRVESGKFRFRIGWGFGIGYFAAGLYWVSYAFLVESDLYGWLIPFALAGLGIGLGLFIGAAFWLAGRFKTSGSLTWVLFASSWMLMEWVRGWIFTGFPWNGQGVVWAPFPIWAQGAAYVGGLGLSFFTVLVMTAPAAGVLGAFGDSRRFLRGFCVLLCGLGLQLGIGWQRLPVESLPNQPDVKLRIVQPNIPQTEKWAPDRRYDDILNMILMSQQTGWSGVTHVIWPETAVTYPLNSEGEFYLRLVAQAAPRQGWLITGSPRRTPKNHPLQVWNSVYAIDSHGGIGSVYDKSHLVPFGEYVPFSQYIPLTKLTAGRVDFTPGTGPRTVVLPRTPPYSPLVCYEIIFPNQVVDQSSRPDWILNVTNDGWFGLSAGPYQHFALAVLRAIEQGLPVVRAANTGISGVVDPYGHVVAQIGLGHKGVLDVYLPQPLVKTLYSRCGDWVPMLMAVVFVLLAFIQSRMWKNLQRSVL